MTACSACRCDRHYYDYLSEAPPKDRICGIWVIDPDRTDWAEAKPLLEDGSIGPQRGRLQISPDGRFDIEDLPDFSKFHRGPIAPHLSASGGWQIKFDVMTERVYLWLEFDKVDGRSTEDKVATIRFLCEGEEYFLHVTIRDPDQGDALVMRKSENPPKASPDTDEKPSN